MQKLREKVEWEKRTTKWNENLEQESSVWKYREEVEWKWREEEVTKSEKKKARKNGVKIDRDLIDKREKVEGEKRRMESV